MNTDSDITSFRYWAPNCLVFGLHMFAERIATLHKKTEDEILILCRMGTYASICKDKGWTNNIVLRAIERVEDVFGEAPH